MRASVGGKPYRPKTTIRNATSRKSRVPAYTRRTPYETEMVDASQSTSRIVSEATTTRPIAITASPWPSRLAALRAALWCVSAGEVEATATAVIDQGASTSAVVISWSRRLSSVTATASPAKSAIQLARLYVK